jgi:hypothetical protein
VPVSKSAMAAALTSGSTDQSAMPPFHGSEVAAAKIALESAIAKVEAEAVSRGPIPKATPAAGPTRRAGHSARTGRNTWLTELLERASNVEGNDAQDFAPKPTRSGDK